MEVQLLKRRLSTPRAALVVAVAAVVAASVAVVPSLAKPAKQTGSVLTSQRAAKVYVSNKKASTLYLRKKAASNLYVAKSDAQLPPVVGIAAGTAPFSSNGDRGRVHPDRVHLVRDQGDGQLSGDHVLRERDLHRRKTDRRPGLPGADPG